jgi:hypothetical protein
VGDVDIPGPHSELYRIIILPNKYNYHSIDITASAPIILTHGEHDRFGRKSELMNGQLFIICSKIPSAVGSIVLFLEDTTSGAGHIAGL